MKVKFKNYVIPQRLVLSILMLCSSNAISQEVSDRGLLDEVRELMVEVRRNAGAIGDVRTSLVTPEKFMDINPGWVWMDGRNVAGSKYAELFSTVAVPNTKDQFLRGMGGRHDDTEQSLKNQPRKPGSYQADSTAMPTKGFSGSAVSAGEHSHAQRVYSANGNRNRLWVRDTVQQKWINQNLLGTPAPAHSHVVAISGGDNETRPENIAVFFYVKID